MTVVAVAAVLTIGALACLPAGEPPAGRRLLADRTAEVLAIVPPSSPDDARVRVLITRSRDDGAAFARALDLFLVSDADAGVGGQPQLVVERWVDEQGLPCHEYLCRIERDSRGRLLVYWTATAGSRDRQLLRFDPVTGQRSELGLIRSFALSGSGRRLAVTSDVGLRKLYDEEDRVVELADAQGDFAFVNDDIYYVDTAWRLQRLPPGGVSEVVVDRVDGFSVVPTTKGPLIVLRLSGPTDNDPSAPAGYAVFDPVSGKASAPIAESRWLGDQTLSPDGTSLVLQDPDDTTGPRLALMDRAAGSEDPFELPGPRYFYDMEWRPGGAEVWFWRDREIVIKRAHEPLASVQATGYRYRSLPSEYGRSASFFTRDGSRWFAVEAATAADRWSVLVGSTSNPSSPLRPVNPPETGSYQYWEVGGLLLAEAWYSLPTKTDFVLVDPETGASRLVGKGGWIVAAGRRRALALVHVVERVADLVAIDLDTGVSTRLAENVRSVVAEPSVSDDPLPPGARIAFIVAHALTSPHDGLWIATLP